MAITPTKNELRSQTTRKKIAEAAQELFSEYGFQNVSMKEIAAQAGVTTGALYHHFKNKDDLIMGVYGLHEPKFEELSATYANSVHPLSDLDDYLGNIMVDCVIEDGFEFTRQRVRFYYDYNRKTGFDACLETIVNRGIELGCFVGEYTKDELIDCISAVFRGATYQYAVSIPEFDLSAAVHRRLSMLLQGIAKSTK